MPKNTWSPAAWWALSGDLGQELPAVRCVVVVVVRRVVVAVVVRVVVLVLDRVVGWVSGTWLTTLVGDGLVDSSSAWLSALVRNTPITVASTAPTAPITAACRSNAISPPITGTARTQRMRAAVERDVGPNVGHAITIPAGQAFASGPQETTAPSAVTRHTR